MIDGIWQKNTNFAPNIFFYKKTEIEMLRITALLLAMLTAYIPAMAQGGQPIFQVGGQDVYATEFLHHHPEYTRGGDTNGLCQAIMQYADLRTQVCEARRLRLDTTGHYRMAMQYHRHREMERHITSGPKARKIVQDIILHSQYMYNVSVMRFDIYANSHGDTLAAYRKALRAKEMVASGGNFESVARQISDDPQAKTNGGYLGWASPISIHAGAEIHEYIYAHHSGNEGISRPIRSGNSYYIVKTGGRRQAIDTVTVAPIIIRKRLSAKINDSLRTLMQDIHGKLEAGGDFHAMQLEYSDIKFSQTLPLDKAYAIYSTHLLDKADKGRHGDLIETADYFCIPRIEYTHNLEISVRHQKWLRESMPGTVMYQNMSGFFMDSIRSISQYSRKGSLAVICKLMPDSSVFEAQWNPGSLRYLSQPLLSYAGKDYSYADFAEYIRDNQYKTGYGKIPEYVEERYQDYLDIITSREAYAYLEKNDAQYRKALENDSHQALCNMLANSPAYPSGRPTMQQAMQYCRERGISPRTCHIIRMRLYDYHDPANKKKIMKTAETLASDSTAAPGLATLAAKGTYGPGSNSAADLIIDGLDNGKYHMPANRIIYLDSMNSFAIVDHVQKPEPLSESETYSIVADRCAASEKARWMEELRQRHGLRMMPDACRTVAEALR